MSRISSKAEKAVLLTPGFADKAGHFPRDFSLFKFQVFYREMNSSTFPNSSWEKLAKARESRVFLDFQPILASLQALNVRVLTTGLCVFAA